MCVLTCVCNENKFKNSKIKSNFKFRKSKFENQKEKSSKIFFFWIHTISKYMCGVCRPGNVRHKIGTIVCERVWRGGQQHREEEEKEEECGRFGFFILCQSGRVAPLGKRKLALFRKMLSRLFHRSRKMIGLTVCGL